MASRKAMTSALPSTAVALPVAAAAAAGVGVAAACPGVEADGEAGAEARVASDSAAAKPAFTALATSVC